MKVTGFLACAAAAAMGCLATGRWAAALPVAVAGWVVPAASIWPVFLLLAVFGVSGHFMLTWAFRRAPAGVLAVVDYLALPYAALLGFAVFGEVPPLAMWFGALLIVGACLGVTRLRT